MPWKEPGKGGQDPWKSGDRPPDLDEVFKNLRSRFRSLFGGGGSGSRTGGSGSGGGLLPLILLLGLFWIVWDSVHIIDEAERGVVLRFGKFTRELPPGINLTFPRPVESVQKVDMTVHSVEDRGHMLTEDENLVEFSYKVQYRINSASDFLFKVDEPEVTLKQAAESALRESVGTSGLDDILEGSTRELVRQESQRVLQETLDRYQAGIRVTEFNLSDVNVPSQVREAYSDVIRAREDRQRFIEEARVHANSVVPEARGSAARVVQEAQGYRDSTIALAEGEADRFTYLLKEYKQAPAVTRKRLYLETMQDVLSRTRKVMMDAESSGNVLYLPLDQLGTGSQEAAKRVTPVIGSDSGSSSDKDARGAVKREGRQ